MIVDSDKFSFTASPAVARARRVLIKPCANYPLPYPVSTSREMIRGVIEGIRRVSDADVLILEGTPSGSPIYDTYKSVGYDFPRVLMLDVRDCIWVEVENPLPHPFVVPTFWVPNVVLSSDYLITVAPFRATRRSGNFTIANLLSLLPVAKYQESGENDWEGLYKLGIEKVIADLYFTLPFDLGIIEATRQFFTVDDATGGEIRDYGRIFIGEPYEVDREASSAAGLETEYLNLIETGRVQLEN